MTTLSKRAINVGHLHRLRLELLAAGGIDDAQVDLVVEILEGAAANEHHVAGVDVQRDRFLFTADEGESADEGECLVGNHLPFHQGEEALLQHDPDGVRFAGHDR
jgi:hypothetical protein